MPRRSGWRNMRNFYQKRCSKCHVWVKPGEGIYDRGIVYHETCPVLTPEQQKSKAEFERDLQRFAPITWAETKAEPGR
jgi:hypothetical protein